MASRSEYHHHHFSLLIDPGTYAAMSYATATVTLNTDSLALLALSVLSTYGDALPLFSADSIPPPMITFTETTL